MTVGQLIQRLSECPQNWTVCFINEKIKPDGSIDESFIEVGLIDIKRNTSFLNNKGAKGNSNFITLE